MQHKIGFLLHSLTASGSVLSFLHMLKAIDHELTDYVIFLSADAEVSESLLQQFNLTLEGKIVRTAVLPIHCHASGTQYYAEIPFIVRKGVRRLARLINEHGIDILHINTTVFSHTLSTLRSRTRAKLIVHVREMILKGDSPRLGRYMLRSIEKYADRIIAISDNEARQFPPSEKVIVLPNPFDPSLVPSVPTPTFREERQIPHDTLLIGMASTFRKSKGHLYLLRIAEALKTGSSLPPFRFVVVGVQTDKEISRSLLKRTVKRVLRIVGLYTPHEELFFNYLRQHRLDDVIEPVRHTENVLSILNQCDVIVRLGESSDPWGRDIIEAMAMKKPIVATGDSEFYIKNHQTGWLVNYNDIPATLTALKSLLTDPHARTSMGQAGYERIIALCDPAKYGQAILRLSRSMEDQK